MALRKAFPQVPYRGSHGSQEVPDARQPKQRLTKKAQPQSKQTQQKKTKKLSVSTQQKTQQTQQKQTQLSADEAAVQQFINSPAFHEKVSMEVEKQLVTQRKSARFDRVYNRALKVMRQFALLADGDPEVYTEEGDLLLEYIGKMTKLHCKRKRMPLKELQEFDKANAAFARLKHKRPQDAQESTRQ